MVDRVRDVEELFPIWDLDGSGFIEWGELQQVLEGCERLETRKEKKAAARLKAKMIENGKVRPLDLVCFVKFITELLEVVADDDWTTTIDHLKEGICEAQSLTSEDRHKRVQWSLFRLLDVNQDGVVDFNEISGLLNSQSRPLSQRKAAAKWQLRLQEQTSTKGTDLKLDLKSFHQFIESIFKELTEEEYVESMCEVEQELSKKNNPAFHRKYIERENITDLVHNIASHVLLLKPKDPLDGIIEYLESIKPGA